MNSEPMRSTSALDRRLQKRMNIHRRWFIVVGVGALAMPAASLAQPQTGKLFRIGLLSPFSPSATASWHQAFRLGLRDLGWIEGQNISIVYRYADGRNDRLPELAADLVHQKVDVIVAALVIDAVAAKEATSAIPIVVASAGDKAFELVLNMRTAKTRAKSRRACPS